MFSNLSLSELKYAIKDIVDVLSFASKWDDSGNGEKKYNQQLKEAYEELRKREAFSRYHYKV